MNKKESLILGFTLGMLLGLLSTKYREKQSSNFLLEENTRLIEINTRLNNQNLDLNKRCVYKELK